MSNETAENFSDLAVAEDIDQLREAKRDALQPVIQRMLNLFKAEGFTLDDVMLAMHSATSKVYPNAPIDLLSEFEELGFQFLDRRDGRVVVLKNPHQDN